MDNQRIMDFLAQLEQNNSLEWMHAHKKEYTDAKAAFEELVGALITRLAAFDPSVAGLDPASLVFRLNRDTRFSRDKSPYAPIFRAHISSAGRGPFPAGYFLVVSGHGAFLGGGIFASAFKEVTQMVRDRIVSHEKEFLQIIEAPGFQGRFTVDGERLKNVPAGYDRDHPLAEYLKHKSWYIEYPVAQAQAADGEAFLDLAAEAFQAMKPFNDFLNEAIRGFEMPERP